MKKNIVVKTWVKKPNDIALKKTAKMNMLELVKKIEDCGFECEAGSIRAFVSWIELKKEINKL